MTTRLTPPRLVLGQAMVDFNVIVQLFDEWTLFKYDQVDPPSILDHLRGKFGPESNMALTFEQCASAVGYNL